MSEKLTPTDLQERYDRESIEYDKKRYASPKGKYYENTEAELLRKLCKNSKVICDIATGTGKNILALSAQCQLVVGVDISLKMLEKARVKCNEFKIRNYYLIQTDANNLPFKEDSFNAVLSSKFFHNFPVHTHKQFFNEMARVSKSIVIIELMNRLMWFGLGSIGIRLRNSIRMKSGRRDYFPWQYSKITGLYKKRKMYGFGAGIPFSDVIFNYLPLVFKRFNHIFTYTSLKYIAPKVFLSINVGNKTN